MPFDKFGSPLLDLPGRVGEELTVGRAVALEGQGVLLCRGQFDRPGFRHRAETLEDQGFALPDELKNVDQGSSRRLQELLESVE